MQRARDFMSTELLCFTPALPIDAALAQLLERGVSGAPVVGERGELAGILTERDVVAAVYRASYHQELAGLVRDAMTREVTTVDADADLVQVAELFLKSRHRRFPVVEGARVVGLLSRRDVLRAIQALWRTPL